MEPVEINAGAWYLRSLRTDERISDAPALAAVADVFAGSVLADQAPADFISAADAGWTDESRFTWAVCEPITGEMVALIIAIPVGADEVSLTGHLIATSATPAGTPDEALAAGLASAERFCAAALSRSRRACT